MRTDDERIVIINNITKNNTTNGEASHDLISADGINSRRAPICYATWGVILFTLMVSIHMFYSINNFTSEIQWFSHKYRVDVFSLLKLFLIPGGEGGTIQERFVAIGTLAFNLSEDVIMTTNARCGRTLMNRFASFVVTGEIVSHCESATAAQFFNTIMLDSGILVNYGGNLIRDSILTLSAIAYTRRHIKAICSTETTKTEKLI